MENFFGLIKQEMYDERIFTSFEEWKDAGANYINDSNHQRIKAKLTGMSSVQYRIHISQPAK